MVVVIHYWLTVRNLGFNRWANLLRDRDRKPASLCHHYPLLNLLLEANPLVMGNTRGYVFSKNTDGTWDISEPTL